LDNKINNNDALEGLRAQQNRDQRPPAGQMPPGFRPGPMPQPGPGQRPPVRPTPPGPGPARPPFRPTPPGPGPAVPPSGPFPPGLQQPRSAPPDFIPSGPFSERGFGNQPAQSRERFRGDMRTRPRDFNRCMNSFTYLWLINGNNFWFYPVAIDRQFVIGFRWRRNRWEFDRINLNRILFYVCF